MQDFIQQLQDQLTRLWEQISLQQKILFVAIPVLLLATMGVAVYYVSQPQYVQLLQTSDAGQLAEIKTYLDANQIKYSIGADGKSIMVDEEIKNITAIDLAGQGLIGFDAGPGFELFDKVQLGMTDRMFDAQYRRILQNTLSEVIAEGARIDSARVAINPGRTALFKSDKVAPSASVKIIAKRDLDSSEVKGIQNLVAAAVTGLQAGQVIVTDKNNRTLSEDNNIEPGVREASRQLQVQVSVENYIRQKLEQRLEKIAGPDNYDIAINATLDWEKQSTQEIVIDAETQAAISEKTYIEESKTKGISGPPGVAANVQDEGIGAEAEETGTTVEEAITNYNYPWSKILKEKSQGAIKDLFVSISIDYIEDENGALIERDPQIISQWTGTLRTAAGLPQTPLPNEPSTFVLDPSPFDRSLEEMQAREEFWQMLGNVFRTLLPLILLLAVGYLAYLFFQRAFAPAAIEEEEIEDEVPIEPVTETRELSLQQLGLAEFGDIANLPAEEQRRIKMQEHVINYAAEKPEEVAAIIKAWLNS